jgi:hypothetical protein
MAALTALWSQRTIAPTHRIDDSFHLVTRGMTLAEVEATFGGPPGVYSERNQSVARLGIGSGTTGGVTFKDVRKWTGDEIQVSVSFDASKRVNHFWISEYYGACEESILQMIQRWFSLK